MNKKRLYGALAIIIVVINALLTFMPANLSVELSEGVRRLLSDFGIIRNFHEVRSDAHFLIYSIIGIVVTVYGKENAWSFYKIILIGCFIGLFDESIKILLPTREFDLSDLMIDYAGYFVFAFVVKTIQSQIARRRKD